MLETKFLRVNNNENQFLSQMYRTYLTGMIDKPCSISLLGGINCKVIIHFEHVAANTFRLVILLTIISKSVPDNLNKWQNQRNVINNLSLLIYYKLKKTVRKKHILLQHIQSPSLQPQYHGDKIVLCHEYQTERHQQMS